MTKRAPQTLDKFIVRLPDGMRDRLSAAARSTGRSMTAELVHRLDASFAQDGATAARPSDLAARIASVEDKLGTLRAAVHELQMDNAGMKLRIDALEKMK